jgi:hypothetical protein
VADRRRDAIARQSSNSIAQLNVGVQSRGSGSALTAAAQLLSDVDARRPYQYETWQDEAWDMYASLGEFNYGCEWFGEAVSRVRLKTAITTPDSDEPEVVDDGTAADLVSQLVGGADGQSQLMRSMAVQLSVVGDAFLIGREVDEYDLFTGVLLDAEPDENGRVWTVNPVNTVRQQRGGFRSLMRAERVRRQWEVQVDEGLWIKLPEESLVCRIWDRNERFPWRAMSPARPALPIMREIDMYNRQVIASLLSRIALNGMLLIPDEVVLPASSGYEEAVDPFMAELIDIMRAAIKNPGAPSSAVPMPVRIPAEYIEKVKHLTFATPLDERLFEQRNQALSRLATTLNLPAEIITGMGQSNHWCVDTATKIFTQDRGWVTHDALTIGDVVLTLNHDVGVSEWQPVVDIYRADVIDEPMRLIHDRFHSSLTTMDHRWPVVTQHGERVCHTSKTLNSSDRLLLGVPHVELPIESKYSDAFVQLVAWMIVDGKFRRWQPKYNGMLQVVIEQSHHAHPENVVEIRRVLTEAFGESSLSRPGVYATVPSWREHRFGNNRGITTWVLNRVVAELLSTVMSIPDRVVNRDFIYSLTRGQLELFVDVFTSRDSNSSRDNYQSAQRVAERLDALELVGTLLGHTMTRSVRESRSSKRKLLHKVTGIRPANRVVTGSMMPVGNVLGGVGSSITYTGTIWCPVTSNGTWFAQRNGHSFFTGNSAWNLTEGAIKFHIVPKVEIITRCLTIGYLHPMLRASGEDVRDKNGNRIIVWYDTSELTQRPDRSANAIKLREMLIITDDATLRETGFNNDDKPTDDELEKMVLQKLAINPQTAMPALKELTGLDLAPGNVQDSSAQDTGTQGTESSVNTENTGSESLPLTQEVTQPTPDKAVPPTQSSLTASVHRDALVASTHSVRRRARASLVRR